ELAVARLPRHQPARRVAADLSDRHIADLRLLGRPGLAAVIRARGRRDGLGRLDDRAPHGVRPQVADPADDHARPVPDDADHADRARRDARGPACRLHQVRARSRALAPRRQFRSRAQEHACAGHHHYRPAARLDLRLFDHHRDRVPVAGHGLAVPAGRAAGRHPDHGGLSHARRGDLHGRQFHRRHPLRRGRSAHPHSGGRGLSEIVAPANIPPAPRSAFRRFLDSDMFYSFIGSPVTVVAAVITVVLVAAALAAPLIAPHNPFDPASLSITDSLLPPAWSHDGTSTYLLGTDDQGRDVLSTILYGMRISLSVGFASVLLAIVIGVPLGLAAGYFGGYADALIMRVADVQLTFPAILTALLIDGVARGIAGPQAYNDVVFPVLVISIGLSFWVQYARTVRGSVLVEANKEYVLAARLIGLRPVAILIRHVLPNVLGPVLVIATINLALAIITEATLSFLGVGIPPTQPSLGTLIRIGDDFLFS